MSDDEKYKVKLPNGEIIDRRTVFFMGAGQYLSEMFFVKLPPLLVKNKGGDLTGLLWRKNEEPTHWVLQMRFRYYKSDKIWNSGDEKSWNWVELDAPTEQEAQEKVTEALAIICGTASGVFQIELEPDRMRIQGGYPEFQAAVERHKPSWLHQQSMTSE